MRIYNTLTRQKEPFETLEPGIVKMYVCGPTVYDKIHLGNARPLVTFDTLRRYLEHVGYTVRYVQNFTDIDDRLILRANDAKTTVRALADAMIDEYFHDADALHIKRATVHPRATDALDAIIDLITTLMDKGYAYVSSTGVYFSMERFERYGRLSGQNLDQLEEGAGQRVDLSDDKRDPMDFALWKFKKPGEPFFASPWGEGRPGWHIECSAMARAYLGDTIDLHCGGQDLVFPHHENEIAQSEAATGKTFARYWMHNGFVNINYEKMSKSTGNFIQLRDLAARYSYEVLRFFILQSHYRMPINFSDDLLDASVKSHQRIATCLENLDFVAAGAAPNDTNDDALAEARNAAVAAWNDGMADDLNTADALAALFSLVRTANQALKDKTLTPAAAAATAAVLREHLALMGLDPKPKDDGVPADIMALVVARREAKAEKRYADADRLREQIMAAGYKIEDTPLGPKVSPLS